MHDKQRFIRNTLLLEIAFLLPDIVAAVLARSLTVWADLLRCAIETLAVFLAWVTIRRVDRAEAEPQRYEYGLGKLESLSTVGIAGIFVVAAAYIVIDAWGALQAPERLVWRQIGLAFGLNLVAVVVDGRLWWRHRTLAAVEPSPVLEAETRLYAIKLASDLLVGIVLALGASLPWAWVSYLDPLSSLAIAAVMVHSAYGIVSESVGDLLDVALDESLQLRVVRALVHHFDDYRELHGVRSRRAGSAVFVEVFLEFDPDARMADVQSVIDRMRDGMMREIPGSFVTIVPATAAPVRSPARARAAGVQA